MAIGSRLREARTRAGVEIREVEEATKIRSRYLRALENEEFELLPGSAFVRTFLKSYADYLGLDARLLVEEYRAQHEPVAEAETQPLAREPRRTREPRPPAFGPWALIGAGAVAVLALLFVIGLLAGQEEEPSSDGSRQASESTPSEPRSSGRRERRRASGSADERKRERERERESTRVSLRITPTVPTYLCVDDGEGKVLFEGTIESRRSFRGKHLRINLGKTSATVRANGKRVPLDRSDPNPVGFDFTPGEREPLALGSRPCA